MTESEVLVSVMKRKIKRGEIQNLQHYADVFFADGRITEEQRIDIYQLLGIEPGVNAELEDMKAALKELGVSNE